MARNAILTRRDWVQDSSVTFSNGDWLDDSPLTNLLDPRPQFVTIAVDNNSAASTKFDVDLGSVRQIGLIFFANLKPVASDATMRVRLSTVSNFATSVYNTGIVSCRPIDSTPGGEDHWGNSTVDGAMLEDEYIALGRPRIFIPNSIESAQYIRVEIFYRGSGWLPIGCFGACEIWESPIDFAPAPSITFIDESEISRINYGSVFVTKKGLRRRMNFGFPALENEEVWNRTLGLALIKGRSQPIVAVAYPDDEANLEKTSVYGLISTDGVISNPFFGHYAQPVQIDQLI